MRNIALSAQTVLDAGPVGLVRAAAAAGFTHVGPRIMPLRESDPPLCGTPLEGELMRALDETGVRIMEAGVFPIAAQMDWPAVTAAVDLSGRAGTQFLGCPCDDADLARSRDTLRRLCDLAEPHGITVLVEFSPRRACASLGMAADLVGASGRANAGLLVDVLHLSRSGAEPEDLATVDPALIRLVHFCDAPAFAPDAGSEALRAEAHDARLLPGEGELWLDRLIKALPADTPLSIEAPSARHRHLPPAERAALALRCTIDVLERAGERP